MTFGQWYVRHGRITRRTWWLKYALPLAALGTSAGIVDALLGYPPPASEGWSIYTYLGGPVSIAVLLFTLVPSLSSSVARLHDRSHSAWWLLWVLLPVVGGLVILVQNGCLRGDGGSNRYGPAPDVPPVLPVYL
jgi:uncharacterized membrane protein YhaH (DUF805 family)